MSFDINWDNLVSDSAISDSIKDFLDSQFQSLSLPSYIANLSVTSFSLGQTAPEITIRHISDPFDEFYEDAPDDESHDGPVASSDDYNMSPRSINDPSTPQKRASRQFHNLSEEDTDDSSDPFSDSSDDDEANSSNISNTTRSSGMPPPIPTHPDLSRSRMASDSIFQLHGNLNHLHNYNMNNVGLGNLNATSSHTGTDTPTTIFNKNPYNNFRTTSASSIPSKQGNTTNKSAKIISGNKKSPAKHENDIQFIVEIDYHGDLHMEVTVNLLVNYPSTNFISLPIKLHISDLIIHSVASIAYLKQSVFFSFLCDINETNSDYFTSSHRNYSTTSNSSNQQQNPDFNVANGGNFVDYVTGPTNRERIDIIKKIHIESEIGEVENNVLRNVGKVERFLVEQLRNIIRDEIAWPGWVCFDLNEDDSDEAETDEEGSDVDSNETK